MTANQSPDCEKSNSLLEEIENLAVGISQLAGSASNLSSVYQSKASDEAELPTVSSALRNTNQVCANPYKSYIVHTFYSPWATFYTDIAVVLIYT